MDSLKPCPSCNGDAEVIQFPVADDMLWQVNCQDCGMATEMDDERIICIQHWNRRVKEERLRYLVTLLGVLLPAGMLLMFFLGALLGVSMISGNALG
ncbi:Lar family restriction alleviation protein [Parendozoicomonas haliclonae]|nr:Lar family restriction alleviation protein [Parendozoicomonas haliclonae]